MTGLRKPCIAPETRIIFFGDPTSCAFRSEMLPVYHTRERRQASPLAIISSLRKLLLCLPDLLLICRLGLIKALCLHAAENIGLYFVLVVKNVQEGVPELGIHAFACVSVVPGSDMLLTDKEIVEHFLLVEYRRALVEVSHDPCPPFTEEIP